MATGGSMLELQGVHKRFGELHVLRGIDLDVGDRVAFMDEGMVVEQGRPTDVLDNPKDDRTKRFLGLVLEH